MKPEFFEFRSRNEQLGEYRASIRLSAVTQITQPEHSVYGEMLPYVRVGAAGHEIVDVADLDRLRAALGIIEPTEESGFVTFMYGNGKTVEAVRVPIPFQSEEEPEETVFTPDPILTEIATVAAMVDAATKAETK